MRKAETSSFAQGLGLLEVLATDSGPGIPLAVLGSRSLGTRSGAVQRLTHELEIGTVGDPAGLAALGMASRDGGPASSPDVIWRGPMNILHASRSLPKTASRAAATRCLRASG